MKPSMALVTISCAAMLCGATRPALAQRGGGHGGGAVSRGGGGGMVHGGGRGMMAGPVMGPRGPAIHGGPFVRGAPIVRGGPFVHGGGFVHGPFVRGGAFVHGPFAHNGFVRVAPVHFFRPYYTFVPHVSLGFGLWGGYPFAYPYAFYNPYYYPYDYDPPYAYPSYDY